MHLDLQRILANENIPGPVVRALRAAGHDMLWVKEIMAGAKDRVCQACRATMAETQFSTLRAGTFPLPFGEMTIATRSEAVMAPSAVTIASANAYGRMPPSMSEGNFPQVDASAVPLMMARDFGNRPAVKAT